MTQEEKQLLLKELCARLPYGIICDRLGQSKKLLSVSPYKVYCLEFDNGEYMPGEYKVEDIKLYLRPMSSMTNDEQKEFLHYASVFHNYLIGGNDSFYTHYQMVDWLNAHHFDYRGLIEMGLALEAPEGMYKTE